MQQKKAIKNKSEISKIIKKGNKIKNMQPFWEGKKGIEKEERRGEEEKRDNKKIIKKRESAVYHVQQGDKRRK